MADFVLFSLETLVNLPRLYSFALKKVFPDMSYESIMETIADVGADIHLLTQNICFSRHPPEFARMTDNFVPFSEAERYVSEVGDYCDEISRYRKELEKVLHEDSDKCVKRYVFDLVHQTGLVHNVGLFGIYRQNLMNEIGVKLNLPFDVVVGYENEKTVKEIIEKAKKLSNCDNMWLVVRDSKYDFRKIAESLGAHYIEVEKSIDAPLCRVQSVLGLNV